jgi:hypothetical protein
MFRQTGIGVAQDYVTANSALLDPRHYSVATGWGKTGGLAFKKYICL